jgi:aspartate aminotransferase/aminotransferase
MPISGIRFVMDLAAQIPDAIHLEVGQPDFRTPPHIVEAAHRAALDGYTAYTPNAGLPSLREACAAKVSRENGIAATVENVLITVGSEGAIASAFVALVDAGDEVLVPEPGWTNYAMLTYARGGTPVPYLLDEAADFIPDVEEVASHVSPRTKLLVVNSPANPTGAVYPDETMEALVALADRHNLYILSDEAYEKLAFHGRHVSPASFDREGRVVTAFSFSKTYAMTGWRVGFAVAPAPIARLMIQLQEPYYSCAPSVSQKAAEAALSGRQDCVEEMMGAYRQRQRTVLDLLQPTGRVAYQPTGAFYILMNIADTGLASYEFARRCLDKTHVAVAPGRTFGDTADRYVRLSVAASDSDVAEGARRLREYVAGPTGA